MKQIVILGGGTGLSVLTEATVMLPDSHLTSIVSVSDNGGSTGMLREDFNIPAVGDIRRVIGAMTPKDHLFRKLMEYRFDDKNAGLKNHTLGNLILAALIDMNGGLSKAIKLTEKYVGTHGDVYAVSDSNLTLMYKYEDGTESEGEVSISQNYGKRIDRVFYKESAKPNLHAIQAVLDADVIVLGIGSLYSSILPNVIFPEIIEALKETKAKIYYVCNIMEEPCETKGYSAQDHVDAVEKHIGKGIIDHVVINSGKIDKDLIEKYKRSDQEIIVDDIKDDRKILFNLVDENNKDNIRHDKKSLTEFFKTIIND